MAKNFFSKLFQGNKEVVPAGAIPCVDGCYICGTVLEDGSVEGNKYCEGELVGSGRFVDGKLSGFGKRFVNGQIMCEGNFDDGFLSGQGKVYSYKGFVTYEGNHAKKPNDYGSAYHGQGREYHCVTGALLYEGEFYYNHWRGKGKEYYPNGQIRYEGEFLDSFWHGRGQYYKQNGELVYSGEFEEEPFTYDR